MAQNRCWSSHEGTSINNRAAPADFFRLQQIKIHDLFIKLERESKNVIYKAVPYTYMRTMSGYVNCCSARDWDRIRITWGNPQSGCSDICSYLKGPL